MRSRFDDQPATNKFHVRQDRPRVRDGVAPRYSLAREASANSNGLLSMQSSGAAFRPKRHLRLVAAGPGGSAAFTRREACGCDAILAFAHDWVTP